MPALGKPRPAKPPATHVIVDRRTWTVVSSHPSLAAARDAWRRRAFPTKGMVKGSLRASASHHLIRTVAAAENAAHRSAIEAAKRSQSA